MCQQLLRHLSGNQDPIFKFGHSWSYVETNLKYLAVLVSGTWGPSSTVVSGSQGNQSMNDTMRARASLHDQLSTQGKFMVIKPVDN